MTAVHLDGKPPPDAGAWEGEALRLRDWFLLHKRDLPTESFELEQGRTVKFPWLFYGYLEECIDRNWASERGPLVRVLGMLHRRFGGES